MRALSIFWFVIFTAGLGQSAQANIEPTLKIEAIAHTAGIRQIAVDATEKWAVTVSDDKTARIWNLQTHALQAILRVPIGAAKLGSLYTVAISPSGDEVAVAGTTGNNQQTHRIYRFSMSTTALLGTIDARAGDIKQLVWTPDGTRLLATYAGAHGMRVFNRKGQVLHEQSFLGASYGAAVSKQGLMAVAAFDGHVHFFKNTNEGITPAGDIKLPIANPVSVNFSPDGAHLVVGYLSRNNRDHVQVDVLDVAQMTLGKSIQFTDIDQGNLMRVAWSQDGSKIYAAGTGYRKLHEILIKQIEWPKTSNVQEVVGGTSSITSVVPLQNGQVAFSNFEPAWGLLQGTQVHYKQAVITHQLKDASSLNVSPDGSVVSLKTASKNSTPVVFDVKQRRLLAQAPANLQAAQTSSMWHWRTRDWENKFTPVINGTAMALAPEEVSRALVLLPDQSAAILGTSWTLRKIDKTGQELWRIAVPTEVAALNVTQDSHIIIMALIDGTIHWLNAQDGSTRLSLLNLLDGRWVVATASGHFDASMGAEGLIGWHVNRPDGTQADFFPASQFRDRFYRPDLINQALGLQANASEPESKGPTLSVKDLPPVLTLASSKIMSSEASKVNFDFSMFSHNATPVDQWQVRVNGRPVDGATIEPPTHTGPGRITLPRPTEAAKVQVFASNPLGVSEPLTVEIAAQAPDSPYPPNERRPNLHVLAIGVTQYADQQLNLLFPAKDAQDMAQVLKAQEGKLYNSVTVRLLTNQEATQQAITEGLAWLQSTAKTGDVSMLFMAGHGINLSGNQYRFLPHNANTKNLKNTETFITEEQIRSVLVSLKSRAIFFIDTCHAGNAIGRLSSGDLQSLDSKLMVNRLSSAQSGVIVFSSSDGSQESLEDKAWNNGAFTKEIINGLKGKADFYAQGQVTHKGLDLFVSHEVSKLTKGLQTPVTIVPMGIPDYALTQYDFIPKR
jgi:WD40 repeat protein